MRYIPFSYIYVMGWFSRKKQNFVFRELERSAYRDRYFVRCAHWRWLNHHEIVVIDPDGPRMLTLDPGPQNIFLAADGMRTVSAYIHFIAKQYSGKVPGNLDITILHELTNLLHYGIIRLSATPGRPEESFDTAGAGVTDFG